MKRDKTELDVDYIGGHSPLTNEEARAISEYLKARKAKKARRKTVTTALKKERQPS
jgi:hypothetical protein